jgi:hypothetical protein
MYCPLVVKLTVMRGDGNQNLLAVAAERASKGAGGHAR